MLVVACFFLPSTYIFAQTATNVHSNPPNIYVDYIAYKSSTNDLGYWIWDKQVLNKQTIHLWKSFSVPESSPVVDAELSVAADNAFKVWMDGKELGSGSDWRTLTIYKLSGILNPGSHVLAVEGFNDCDKAGVIAGMRLRTASGKELLVRSDTSWRVVPDSVSNWQMIREPSGHWPSATFVANIGQLPWWSSPTTIAHVPESFPEPISFWQSPGFQLVLIAGCVLLVVIGIYLLIQLVSQSKSHTLLQIERDRIARDLHDDLGSRITELLLTGESAQIKFNRHPGDTALLAEPMQKICNTARDIVATIGETVWIVNSERNNLNDFATRVCKHAERFLKPASIRCRFDVADELPSRILTETARRNLFLAFKEALCNAAKHSHATELNVRVRLDKSTFIVCVEDNGVGFHKQQTDPERHGLRNLMLRMKEIGGTAQIVSQPGKGCKVLLSLPLKHSFLRRFWSAGARPRPSLQPQTRLHGQTDDAAANHIKVSNV
ncbi:MAG TPA: ATP-binding protein [Verrucomicrobiae bacterium]|jgi:hypothetical protein|nr:ATP-binding protein [Verrucomicrobiae bacterium]